MSHDGLTGPRFDAIVRDLKHAHSLPDEGAMAPLDAVADEAPYESLLAPEAALPGLTGVVLPPASAELDIERLAALMAQARQVTDAATGGTAGGRIPVWAKGRRARLTAWSLAVPTLVTGCANLAAHQWGGTQVAMTGGAVTALAVVLGIAGMNRNWPVAFLTTMFAATMGSVSWSMAAGAGGWMEVVSWLVAALSVVGFTWLWNDKHRGERADAELKEAKVRTERLRGDALESTTAIRNAHALLKLQEAQRAALAEAAPVFAGASLEERELRRAVHLVFRSVLTGCSVRPTLTGWVADITLPGELPRDTVRSGWNKVASALAVPGRFALADGTNTNALVVKFVDETRPRPDAAWAAHRLSDDPRRASLGVDTETGEPVFLDADERLLICGASGTGKSWSARPLMAHWHCHGALVLIDGKGEEGNVWDPVCTVAREPEEIYAVIDAAHAEMSRRKADMKARGISVWDGEQLTVVVDEGQVVLALPGIKKDEDRLQRLIELSSLGRSRGVVLVWATQKPVMSGNSAGVHNLIAPNLLQRFALRVADTQEAQTALDDCAFYNPQKIPQGAEWKGHGYLKGYGPSLIRTWTLDDAAVRSLPSKHWEAVGGTAVAVADDDPAERVQAYRDAHPGASHREIAEGTGVALGSVARLLKKG